MFGRTLQREQKCFSPAKANLKHIDGNCDICTARFSGGMQFSSVAAYLYQPSSSLSSSPS